ncbi:hypothetical protein [Bacillus sp. FJAT-50079]|uniref:hypothetical protein n=1 Tax=Bacillus sp. FJAT-50079 TaxID=2833577 RepID=UPI002016797E|nr:hypothetical protein [Bacillus sp. FJAT-50079]
MMNYQYYQQQVPTTSMHPQPSDRQMPPPQQQFGGFPGIPGFPDFSQMNRRIERLERQVERLDRRVDRIERRLGMTGRPEHFTHQTDYTDGYY